MEIKWICIAVATMLMVLFSGAFYSDTMKIKYLSECKIEALKHDIKPEQIATLCK